MEDYEKKYKDALKRAEKELQHCGSQDCDAAKQIYRLFPELKDSENELTWLIEFIREEADCLSIDIRDDEDRIKLKNLLKSLAWLEKQAAKKMEFNPDILIEECNQDNANHIIDVVTEQEKSVNNIKPKFKVGDWIINEQGSAFLIAYVNEEYQRYEFEIGGYTKEQMNYESIEFTDNHYRLWTIKDAERGDILTSVKSIFIFKGLYMADKPEACCAVIDGSFIECPNACWTNDQCYPATKDQRDILLTKMNDAGYAWNETEKKLVYFKTSEKREQNTEVDTNILLYHKDDKDYEAIKLIKSAMVYCPYMEGEDKKKVNEWLKSIQKKLR